MEVLELMKRSGRVLHVMVVAGGLSPSPAGLSSEGGGKNPVISREKVEKKHYKAKAFQSKVCQHSLVLLLGRKYRENFGVEINIFMALFKFLVEDTLCRHYATLHYMLHTGFNISARNASLTCTSTVNCLFVCHTHCIRRSTTTSSEIL